MTLGVELATGDCSHMALGVHHVSDVHVTSHCSLKFLAIARVNASLVVGAATEKHAGVKVRGKGKTPYRMAIKWPKLFVRPQSFVHGIHIPNFYHIVSTTSSDHLSSSVLVKSHRGYRPYVS